MQMCQAAFTILPPFLILFELSVHSASVYLAKMSSDESSDSQMPYDSSDEEVWEVSVLVCVWLGGVCVCVLVCAWV